jgi:hypothetical protein
MYDEFSYEHLCHIKLSQPMCAFNGNITTLEHIFWFLHKAQVAWEWVEILASNMHKHNYQVALLRDKRLQDGDFNVAWHKFYLSHFV